MEINVYNCSYLGVRVKEVESLRTAWAYWKTCVWKGKREKNGKIKRKRKEKCKEWIGTAAQYCINMCEALSSTYRIIKKTAFIYAVSIPSVKSWTELQKTPWSVGEENVLPVTLWAELQPELSTSGLCYLLHNGNVISHTGYGHLSS